MKKKNQLINNKILVEGAEGELSKNEVLVGKTNSGKVSLKEIKDGVLTEITEPYIEPEKYFLANYILSRQKWYSFGAINDLLEEKGYEFMTVTNTLDPSPELEDKIFPQGVQAGDGFVGLDLVFAEDGTGNVIYYCTKPTTGGGHLVNNSDTLYGIEVVREGEDPTYIPHVLTQKISDFEVPATTVLTAINHGWPTP